jgi:iron complex outermembrane receptor protein
MTSLAVAQTAPAPLDDKKDESIKLEKFVVTGSMIKRLAGETALPVTTITRADIEAQGIQSAEQMVANLNINGNGLDNLASNADVVAGAQRGNNGATSANLRGQGSNATLILLNGRRVASHGLNGGVVDLNQIPFAAIERVEVLKDGASSTYGTDAIGGVINFILRENFVGVVANAASDVTELGGANIFRGSITAGYGDMNRGDRFNIMGVFAINEHKALRGDQRDWNNTFQPNRGLSPDTRGAPIATIFAISSIYNILSRDNINSTGRGTGPLDPANPSLRVNGINITDLPTNTSGYAGLDGMGPYDELLWNSPAAKYGSAWDTGRAAVLQQPVRNTSVVLRGTLKVGDNHKIITEAIRARSDSTKSFSPNQITSSTAANTTTLNGTVVPNPFFNLAYPSTGADYNRVYNALVAFFGPGSINNGAPIPFRWRALPGGNREIRTISDTSRYLIAMEGQLPGRLSEWDYRVGASRAESQSKSQLLSGYYYTVPFANLINTGVLNPFSYTQTADAMKQLAAASATGVQLYSGKFITEQMDFATSGPVFKLPAGDLMGAIGVDYRRERYVFAGDPRPNVSTADSLIFNAPFDNALATAGTLKRIIRAAYAELDVPVLKGLDTNISFRTDQYTGFGRTNNPKYTLRWAPTDKFLIRGSYSTGFRVPTFKQMFDPSFLSIYAGADLVDPISHAPILPNTVQTINGGKIDLKPEEAKLYSAGIVAAPFKHLSFSIDWWQVERTGTIQNLGIATILANYQLFPDRVLRDPSNNVAFIDIRPINAGQTITKGVEYGVHGDMDVWGGKLRADLEVSELLEKKSKLIASAPWGASEVGRFTRSSDIGLKWKYTAGVNYRKGHWSALVNKVWRAGYMDAVLPGVASGLVVPPQWNPKVAPYSIYNASLTYTGFKNLKVIAGIKNLFNTDPPFSAAYDTNTGAGSSWEPRIADPRGRSFTLSVEYKFF